MCKIYSAFGYDETLWNSGGSVPIDNLTWDEMTLGERFAAYTIGYDKESWNAVGPGGHFSSRPNSVGSVDNVETKSPTRNPSGLVSCC